MTNGTTTAANARHVRTMDGFPIAERNGEPVWCNGGRPDACSTCAGRHGPVGAACGACDGLGFVTMAAPCAACSGTGRAAVAS